MMTFEAGKTYKTRGGQDALIYAVDVPETSLPIHGRIGAMLCRWTKCGKADGLRYDYELLPPGHISLQTWVNVHSDASIVFFSKESAVAAAEVSEVGHAVLRVAVLCYLEEITE